jgi:hypothetical protein
MILTDIKTGEKLSNFIELGADDIVMADNGIRNYSRNRAPAQAGEQFCPETESESV